MKCKHVFKNIFLISEFCVSLSDKIPKKTFTKLLEKKCSFFLVFMLTVSFYKNESTIYKNNSCCILPNMFFSV